MRSGCGPVGGLPDKTDLTPEHDRAGRVMSSKGSATKGIDHDGHRRAFLAG